MLARPLLAHLLQRALGVLTSRPCKPAARSTRSSGLLLILPRGRLHLLTNQRQESGGSTWSLRPIFAALLTLQPSFGR
jgi:hypothetical protein